MNKIINYILYFVMLCAGTSCIYEDAPEELNESEIGSTYFKLGFSTRAADITDDGGIKNLSLWLIKNGQKEATFYKEYLGKDIEFHLGSDGSYFCFIEGQLNKTDIGEYNVYAIINNYEKFNDELPRSSRASIGEKFDFYNNKYKIHFSNAIRNDILKSGLESGSGIPMYGENTLTINEQNKYASNPASCTVKLTRALSKLELNFAHTDKVTSFVVTNITLRNMPEIGYLVYNASQTSQVIPTGITLFDNKTGQLITSTVSDFTNYHKFQKVDLKDPYLLENTAGGSKSTDTAYIPSTEKPAIDGAYQIEVTYNLNSTTEKTSIISFPRINRNELFKVYILADQQEIYVDVQTSLQWDKGPDLNPEYQ